MAAPIAGPSTPPHARANRDAPAVSVAAPERDPAGSDSESSDEFMPTLPPDFCLRKPAPAPIGPMLPSGFVISDDHINREGSPDDDDDDHDSVAGPAPLPAHLAASVPFQNDGVLALKEREERQKELDRIERESKLLKRDEWMLLPPKELDLQATIDPTKIKARGFKQTSKPHSSTAERGSGSSLWTETPAERSQRLADEATGKRRRAEEIVNNEAEDLEESKRKKRDKLMRHRVDEHNKSSRNASLLALHKTATVNISNAKTRAEKEGDRKLAVTWDHDAMMGVGSKLMSENQKADLIKDAKGLGGRFGGGSFL